MAIANHGIFPDVIGGMERHTFNLASHLTREGVDVTVLVPEPKTSTHYNFPVVHLPWPRRPFWLWSNRKFSEHVGRWIDAHEVDIAFGQGFNLWTYLKKRKIPAIFHPHGLEMYGSHLRLNEWIATFPFRSLVRYHARWSDVTISLGGGLTEILRERVNVPNKKLREIPNAVVPGEYTSKDQHPREREFLFVGRLAFNKGIDLLARALSFVADLNFKLSIVGTGPFQSMVERLAQKDPRVTYLPHSEESRLKQEYQRHQCLLFTSRFEGMPTVVLEAMVSGCAVIATDIGAVNTMVGERNGFLVNPDPREIGDAIRKFLSMPSPAKQKLGENGRSIVLEKYAWPKIVKQYLNLFSELAGVHA